MGIGIFQPWHLILILLIVLIVFGAGKLGQVGGALGQSVKEFKANVGDEDEHKVVTTTTEPVVTETRVTTPVARATERPVESLRREEI